MTQRVLEILFIAGTAALIVVAITCVVGLIHQVNYRQPPCPTCQQCEGAK